MKPRNVVNISIQGRERSAKQLSLETDRVRYADYLRQYRAAGMPVPPAVKEVARKLGVEVEA